MEWYTNRSSNVGGFVYRNQIRDVVETHVHPKKCKIVIRGEVIIDMGRLCC
jgi:hypothetical protein